MSKAMRGLSVSMLTLFIMSILSVFNAEAQSFDSIQRLIASKAIQHNLDPNLIVAIARTESGLNPNAVGAKGEIGVFQLRPEFHDVRNGDTEHNIEVAIKYLSEIRTKWEPTYGNAWFIKYNLGPNYRQIKNPKLFPYYIKVMSNVNRTLADN